MDKAGLISMKYKTIDTLKVAIDKVRPFDRDMLKQTQEYYRVGTTWSSNAIEGNTLTMSETKVILEDGITIGGKPLRDTLEAVGHAQAYDYMFTLLKSGKIDLGNILTLHKLFYEGIDSDNAGQYRKKSVMVSGTNFVFPAPVDIEKQMQELEAWIENERGDCHPVEFAALLHLKFVTIHPFIDGNGRTARLLTNLALIQRGYLPVIVPPILKMEYNDCIRQYQNGDNAQPFIDFIAEQELESEKEMIRLLHIDIEGDTK